MTVVSECPPSESVVNPMANNLRTASNNKICKQGGECCVIANDSSLVAAGKLGNCKNDLEYNFAIQKGLPFVNKLLSKYCKGKKLPV